MLNNTFTWNGPVNGDLYGSLTLAANWWALLSRNRSIHYLKLIFFPVASNAAAWSLAMYPVGTTVSGGWMSPTRDFDHGLSKKKSSVTSLWYCESPWAMVCICCCSRSMAAWSWGFIKLTWNAQLLLLVVLKMINQPFEFGSNFYFYCLSLMVSHCIRICSICSKCFFFFFEWQ